MAKSARSEKDLEAWVKYLTPNFSLTIIENSEDIIGEVMMKLAAVPEESKKDWERLFITFSGKFPQILNKERPRRQKSYSQSESFQFSILLLF